MMYAFIDASMVLTIGLLVAFQPQGADLYESLNGGFVDGAQVGTIR